MIVSKWTTLHRVIARGGPAFAALQKAFGDRYVDAGLGQTLKLAGFHEVGAAQ